MKNMKQIFSNDIAGTAAWSLQAKEFARVRVGAAHAAEPCQGVDILPAVGVYVLHPRREL